MTFSFFKNTVLISLITTFLFCFSCGSQNKENTNNQELVIHDTMSIKKGENIVVGANQKREYLKLLKNKTIGIVANQTSIVKDNTVILENGKEVFTYLNKHLVDFLHHKVTIKAVFAPEHGFRGKADAGEVIKDGVDTKTGLPIISLYGKNKKPTPKQLEGIDMMVFDIQDVGARFYTYISTLHYLMEACAENNIPLLILDRPNPNGHYIDGPILEPKYKSFVGMHPVPVVHGMTIGEYAQMINGEGWLANQVKCKLFIIKMKGYTHQTKYSLPIKPSPNLPNDLAINLYPSLCFFEGTIVSAGRGTNKQFQLFGAPQLPKEHFPYTFTPQANEGSKYPKYKGELCYGKNLDQTPRLNKINLEWLIEAYADYKKKHDFFKPYFTKLAGTTKLQEQIEKGYTYREIRKTWLKGLAEYDRMRQKYLLYD
ncbi:MAG: exo-beta-N-acetylmuramidase NamZ family protein [Flavobacteriales bacterium]